jgi:hypothetical protein
MSVYFGDTLALMTSSAWSVLPAYWSDALGYTHSSILVNVHSGSFCWPGADGSGGGEMVPLPCLSMGSWGFSLLTFMETVQNPRRSESQDCQAYKAA